MVKSDGVQTAMKIAITGATGFVGRNLVPLLADRGVELLLVSREPQRLSALFAGHPSCSYEHLAERAADFDALVHLAVLNNNSGLSRDHFHEANVQLLLQVAQSARAANIGILLNVSSVHALEGGRTSFYADTKREGARRLKEISALRSLSIYLPNVYADEWSGKLSVLNKLPRIFSGLMSIAVSSIIPVVHTDVLATFIVNEASRSVDSDIVISDGQSKNYVYRFCKRTVDLSFSIIVVVLFWWLLIIIWLAVRLESTGPGIFAQVRVGKNGNHFTCFKFRTMKVGTAQVGTHQVSPVAVTKVGSFLRRTKLDELPQIWNILRNEVSLVGPRPCLPVQVELVEARRLRGVLELKPGITGLAQVNDVDMSDPTKLAQWDARYRGLQSLLLDLKLILATAFGRGRGDRVRK